MKFLVLLIVVFAVIWFIRNNRRDDAPGGGGFARTPPPPQEMVECAVCHVHLPRNDALAGPDGRLYCCAEHRKAGA